MAEVRLEEATRRFGSIEALQELDLTVADSNLIQAVLGYRDDVRSARQVRELEVAALAGE